jgi:UDPglucose 6-dehydrogenase
LKISIIGAGYVGLVTGTCLASLGNEVTLVDINKAVLEAISDKRSVPIYEEGLDELLSQVSLKATSDYSAIADSEIIFICVGTLADDGSPIFLDHVATATENIAEILKKRDSYCVVTVKSTVVPGTTQELVIPILERSGKKVGKDFGVCMAPEFLREGKAIYDFMHPSRIVIGEYDTRSGERLAELFGSFNIPIFHTTPGTAEMIKLASNGFLAAKISFINEIGNICKKLGIDTYEVARGMGFDERIGKQFLNAGIGFGGSCLPKDLRMLISRGEQLGYKANILQEILNLNDQQALKPVELLKKHLSPRGATIGLLGLAFKADTNDTRDSRAIRIAQALLDEGATVKAYDPLAVDNFKKLFPTISYVTIDEAMKSDAILILTDCAEFKELDYHGKVVIDGRRIDKAREARIYEGVCW